MEVLVAMVILSIALLAYVTVAVASRSAMDKGADYALAAQVAGDKIADLQGTGYGSLVNGTTTSAVARLSGGQMTVVIGPLDGNAGNTNITQLDVTVTWSAVSTQNPSGAGSLHYSTLISNRR